MSTQFVRNLLSQQRKRAVASIMSAVEHADIVEEDLPAVRKAVLQAINQYHDTTLDIVKSSVDTGMVTNEVALQAIVEFNERTRRLGY